MNARTTAVVRACIDARVPVILWGSPGTAKTAFLLEEAARRGLPAHVVTLSHMEPTEVNGWLQPDSKAGVMRRLLPDWLVAACDAPVMLVLDELSCAPPAVQAAALRLIQERRAGTRALHDATVIVAAANPADQAAGGWDLAAPMANRLVHIQWAADLPTWSAWLAARGPGDAAIRGAVIGYLQRAGGGTHLCCPPASEAASGAAWPSPRSWTALCAVLSTRGAADPDVAAALAEGCVGPGEAAAYLAYRRDADLPDPEDILGDPTGWAIPARHDRAYAALAAVVGAVSARLTVARWHAAIRAHRAVLEAGIADLAAASAMPLLRWKLDPREARSELAQAALPAADIAAFAPLLRAAGLLGGAA